MRNRAGNESAVRQTKLKIFVGKNARTSLPNEIGFPERAPAANFEQHAPHASARWTGTGPDYYHLHYNSAGEKGGNVR